MLDRLRVRMGRPKRPRKNDCARWHTAHDLTRYSKRICSQNGEDGIIAEIFRRVPPQTKTFVEFGVEDGRECNTAYLARRCGWSGFYIEADAARFSALERSYAGYPVRALNAKVTRENVVSLFESLGVPKEPDLLSIDIDGNDYWVWEALGAYRPAVTIVEFNLAYPPPAKWVMAYDPAFAWDDTSHFGASLSSLTDLGKRLGYALLGIDCNVVNAFFIRGDLLAASGLPETTPEAVFHFPPRFPTHPYRPGPSLAQ